MEVKIKKFNPKIIEPCRKCVFIARPGSGKSFLMKDILYHLRKIPMGIVISATEESNEHYKDFVPESFIYGEYQPELVNKVINHQKKVIKKCKTQEEKEKIDNSAFIVMDDCMFNNKWTKDTCMREIFMNGRHFRIAFFFTVQYVVDIPPSMRAQVDYIFILKDNIVDNRMKLWKMLFGIFPTFDSFNQVMTQCTENYECLVLNNRSTSNNIEDVVFWYKAKPRKFYMGGEGLRDFHRRHYNPDHDNPEEDESLKPKSKKNAVSISVVKTDSSGTKKKK